MSNNKTSNLTINVGIDNHIMLQMIRAASRHLTAFADEIENIKHTTCNRCGSALKGKDNDDTKEPFCVVDCPTCGYTGFAIKKHFEGGE